MDSLDWDAEKKDADAEEENTDAELAQLPKGRPTKRLELSIPLTLN